jgi:tetratricopeptide (TPR) repeat protein
MPDDLASFAWLESARLRRTANNIPDMILRYQGLLGHVKNLTENLQAEANYWIGWGMVKSNTAKDAIPYLEKARTLRPDAYRKHAGLLLSLGYFASQDQKKLSEEIDLAIEWNYESDIPNQAIQWSGMQSYNMGDYKVAAKTLALVSNPAEPRETPKEVWRYLAKSRLEIDDPDGALLAANHVLEVEDNSGWKADALLDRGRALLALKRTEDAQKSANEALALHPQGHTSAGLNILVGDLKMKSGDLKTAAGKYLIVVEFHDDKDLKPLALWKLIQVLDQQSDQAEAAKYRQKLTTEFPAWKPPGGSTI